MRTHHALHTLQQFPIYSAAFIGDDVLAVGGGGGSSRSGIKNKLRLYKIISDSKLEQLHELELEKDEDAPMSMAADLVGKRLVCGINSPLEQLEKKVNENCRLFTVEDDRIQLLNKAKTLHVSPETLEDYQRVTALSADGSFVVAAGSKDLAILSYPSLNPAAPPQKTDAEIYDASFSLKELVVATTKNLLIYSIPGGESQPRAENGSSPNASKTGTTGKKKRKGKSAPSSSSSSVAADLQLKKTVPMPSLPGVTGGTSSFRAVRFSTGNENVCYSVTNNSPDRVKGSKSAVKRAFVTRWNTDTWEAVRSNEVGKKGITCFDISSNGKWLAYGAADLSIGVLDAKTLAPLLTILKAHDFPPTVIRFNPGDNLLVSGSADNTMRIVALPPNLGASSVSRSTLILIAFLVVVLSILLSLHYQDALIKP